jgi:hypothetical protein
MPVRGARATTWGRQCSIGTEPRHSTRAFDRANGTVDQGVTYVGVYLHGCSSSQGYGCMTVRLTPPLPLLNWEHAAALGAGELNAGLVLPLRWAWARKCTRCALLYVTTWHFGTASAWDCTTTCCTMATVPNKGQEDLRV